MGAGASVFKDEVSSTALSVTLKKLPEAIEDAIYVREKFPLIIDPTEQASRFLRYQLGSFINADDPILMTQNNLNRCLLGTLKSLQNLIPY